MNNPRNPSSSFSYSDWVDRPGAFTPETFIGNKQQQSLFQSLASPGVKTGISTTSMSQHQVSAHQKGAAAQVEPNQGAVAGVQNDVAASKAVISDTIRTAQAQVAAAAKVCGYDPGELYPDTRIAGSEFELACQAIILPLAAGKIGGAGTFAKVLDKSLAVEDVHSASKSSKSTPEIEAEIREKLIQASSSKPQDTRATVKNIMAADEGPAPEMKKSALGWEKFFEQDHDLKDLMALDPDDPNPKLVPEWKALDDIDNAAENTMDTLLAVEDETLDKGLDNTSDAWRIGVQVYNVGETLPFISGAKVATESVKMGSVDIAVASINKEFRPEEMGLDRNARPDMMGA